MEDVANRITMWAKWRKVLGGTVHSKREIVQYCCEAGNGVQVYIYTWTRANLGTTDVTEKGKCEDMPHVFAESENE